jgi:type IV secretory pathway VirB10-like protein
MRTDFTINVQIGITPELNALAQMLLAGHQLSGLTKANTAATEQPQAVEPAEPQPTAEPATAEMPQPAEPTPASEPQPEEPKEVTAEDVRLAMHQTRQRIEGEDYKDNTESEGYKRYHRALTAEFKKISAMLGADKPSALPEDKRHSFIVQCEDLVGKEDGTIQYQLPF